MDNLKYSVPDGLLLHNYSKDKHQENNDNNNVIQNNITYNKTISNDVYFKIIKNQDNKNKQKTKKYRNI